MKKILKILGLIAIVLLPWTWMFTWKTWLMPVTGNFWGQMSVVGVAIVILVVGIILNRKGYGQRKIK